MLKTLLNRIRNFFMFAGIGAIALLFWLAYINKPYIKEFSEFDDKAYDVYSEMFKRLVETGNPAEATVWKQKVSEGMTVEEVEQVMTSVASEMNIKNVGELPLSHQVELMSGEKQRFLKIYMYCNPLTAMQMVNYSDAFSAYLPCRISLVEDKTGQLWLYTLNMDMMIHGGKPLPPVLKKEAERVRQVIKSILERTASGDF